VSLFATTGYAAVVPDYLGLGDSPGLQLYHHARSEATACVDLLRAARTWCASNNVELNDQLFLAGYSHGGHVTMALHRELEPFTRTSSRSPRPRQWPAPMICRAPPCRMH